MCFGKMLENKRIGAGLTRCSNRSKRTRSSVSGDLIWHTNHGIWSGLGKEGALMLSKSVVSLALSDGNTPLFSSSGIAIECRMDVTKFLTSASLVRALNKYKTKGHDCLKIEVRHEGKVATGFLEEYDLHLEIAVVKITSSLGVHAVFLYHCAMFMPYCDVVSLGRDISGKLMAKTGKLTHDSNGSTEYLMFSSCKLSEVWEGGPLFNCSGKFVGMNLVPSMEKSFFLPVNLIIERMQHFNTCHERTAFLARVEDLKTARVGETLTDIPHFQPASAPSKDHLGYIDALGYPRPTDIGMILVNSFEDHFGDLCGMGVWEQLGRQFRENTYRSVVSLASFNGDTRLFACSGIIIDWGGKSLDKECQTILTSACLVRDPYYSSNRNNIVEGLRIEVLLPFEKRREGTLMHYSLHYNVALVRVSVKGLNVVRVTVPHAIVKRESTNWKTKVASVGRCFKSGVLMASSGKVVPWSGQFDCKKLRYSTCRITLAGIGGPLVDHHGNFIGMNFYDGKVGTPFLFCDYIVDILDCFKKGTGAEISSFRVDGDGSVYLNNWDVPRPHWRHLDEPDDIREYERRIITSGRKFCYEGGSICMLK